MTTKDISEKKSIKISIHIPPHHHDKPIIVDLASKHNLEVNITSAMLGEYADKDGWFNLVLSGEKDSIQQALNYLSDLGIEVWSQTGNGQEIVKDSWGLGEWEITH
ncbi:NIL domain-containing protein [Cyanobacterium sp. IPPAS B-1200]|uniref:NIL domain-containing protein n=1 Tax=Cyanobacterium sp. IPPAS B-1200 TaxID=1562720 RepID=UPI0008524DE6|nr:NIL domain-containing protein [Cyanobacterium sp. IPPAS B-1200]OEJ78597.1 NIL domain-containing protein [Cyanobacterium sp. IPPAS B-1200]